MYVSYPPDGTERGRSSSPAGGSSSSPGGSYTGESGSSDKSPSSTGSSSVVVNDGKDHDAKRSGTVESN